MWILAVWSSLSLRNVTVLEDAVFDVLKPDETNSEALEELAGAGVDLDGARHAQSESAAREHAGAHLPIP